MPTMQMRFDPDPYKRLIYNGILEQACEDYVMAKSGLDRGGRRYNMKELMQFFHSDYFDLLYDMKPDWLIRKLDGIVKNMEYRFDVRKVKKNFEVYSVKDPDKTFGLYDEQAKALGKAAELNGLSMKFYMKMRRKEMNK